MAEVKVSEELEASADAVWTLLSDFGGIAKWGGGIEGCTVEGEGVGAVRTITVGGGASIQERLESCNDAERTFSYAIIGKSPLPVSDYLSTVVVTALGASRARVDWSSTFEPTGVPAEQAQGIIRGVYEGGIKGLKRTLGRS
jgi:carbon monoxide dehydrogenase subunit G